MNVLSHEDCRINWKTNRFKILGNGKTLIIICIEMLL